MRDFVEGVIHDHKITRAENLATKSLNSKGNISKFERDIRNGKLGIDRPLSNPHIYNEYIDKYLSRVDDKGNPQPVDIKHLMDLGITDAQIAFDDRIMSRVMDSFVPDKDGNIKYDAKSLDFILGAMYIPGRRNDLLSMAR